MPVYAHTHGRATTCVGNLKMSGSENVRKLTRSHENLREKILSVGNYLLLTSHLELHQSLIDCCGLHCVAFVMAALCNRAGHYIFALWFLSSSFYLFFLA